MNTIRRIVLERSEGADPVSSTQGFSSQTGSLMENLDYEIESSEIFLVSKIAEDALNSAPMLNVDRSRGRSPTDG